MPDQAKKITEKALKDISSHVAHNFVSMEMKRQNGNVSTVRFEYLFRSDEEIYAYLANFKKKAE